MITRSAATKENQSIASTPTPLLAGRKAGREEVSWELTAGILHPGGQVNEARLYRGLDVLQAHKEQRCAHLLVHLGLELPSAPKLVQNVAEKNGL